MIKGDGVAEWSKASVATRPSIDRFPVAGGIFLRASLGVRRTSAAIPHPDMADTYGCPNRKFCQKHTCANNLQYPPTVPQANDLSCRSINPNNNKKKNNVKTNDII